jgi:hypothetical protein
LKSLAVDNPRIKGEIQPYTLSHGVVTGEFALHDCLACHSFNSRISEDIELSDHIPGDVIPEMVKDSQVKLYGDISNEKGTLVLKPSINPDEIYVHGTDRPMWLDILGILIVIGSVFGAAGHGGLRILASKKRKQE